MESQCYCILPKAFDTLRSGVSAATKSIVVVISPLIALMKDQVRQMSQRKISAVYVGDADEELETKICDGNFKLFT